MGGLVVHPLTPERWPDLVTLFGPRGACWCMTPRLTRAEFERRKGDGNRRALKRLVDSGTVPGVLAYHGGEPVAWCAIEPRTQYPTLERSRILEPVDDRPVWSIVCLFVKRDARRRGVSRKIVERAVDCARSRGATVVEAYPVEPKRDPMPDVFADTGVAATFLQAGLREVARRSPTRPILRRMLRSVKKK